MNKALKTFLIGIVVIVLEGCSSIFSNALIHPNRQPVVKSPSDYGMIYEDIDFSTPDDIVIRGWLIKGSSEYIVIMVPPMNFTKYGYSVDHQGTFKITDIEVEFLKTVKKLHNAGYTVLAFDLRNHGESDDHPGNLFALGNYEYNDVIGALNYVQSRSDLTDKNQVFVSFCTGANATFLAMKEEPGLFSKVEAMVAIQPISTEVFVTNFMKDKYPIFTGMIPSIEKDIIKATGFSFNDLSPERYIDGLLVPTLFVQAKEDKWTDYKFVEKLYSLAPVEEKEILLFEGDMHRFDTYNYFGHSPEKLLSFLENNKRD